MADTQKINEAIDQMIKALNEFKTILGTQKPVVAAQEIEVKKPEEFDDFESLKAALLSDKWPEAVNPNLICQPDSESDKMERGRGIVELMIEEDLKDLKVLDFGCGEGQCAYVSTEYNPKLVVGYDIKQSQSWAGYSKENLVFTTNFQDVMDKGPYDVIILFDVIDHAKNEDATSILKKAQSVLSDNGKIYMRCHPFTSRHATHLYHDINKAYIHLVFSPDEVKDLVPNSKYVEDSIKVVTPIASYQKFIEDSNLKIVTRRDITSKVEPFFKIPKIAERIIKHVNFREFPEFQMSMDFLDYVLKK